MKKKEEKGITLVALVITIIVLLILAGVSIATLTGQNGILTQADSAKEKSEVASVKEQAQLDITNWIAERLKNGEDTTISKAEDIKKILDEANKDNTNKYYTGYTETGIKTPNGYEVPFEELYVKGPGGAITEVKVSDYGKKVDYQSKEDTSLIWRIFCADENYVYLISSKENGSNTIESSQLSNYQDEYEGSMDIVPELRFLNQK